MLRPLLSVLPRQVVFVSYRLGGSDGVSVEAAKWVRAFLSLGATVRTVAGSGVADVLLPELAADFELPAQFAGTAQHPGPDEPGPIGLAGPAEPAVPDTDLARGLSRALGGADLVVVENVLSLPLNPVAGRALARVLSGRPSLLRHHDLASQRSRFVSLARQWPPDDPCWRHVTINERSRLELESRGIRATTVYNRFDPDPPAGDRSGTRSLVGFDDDELVVLQPTRAIRRKNVPGGLRLAASLGATYWLLGAAEDGYGPELELLLSRAPCRVVLGTGAAKSQISIPDAYAACDAVVLPSTWEGFGNPSLESALHRRPLAIGNYPVAFELRRYGFSWFDAREPEPLARFLRTPDETLLDRNQYVARARFSTADLPDTLRSLLTGG